MKERVVGVLALFVLVMGVCVILPAGTLAKKSHTVRKWTYKRLQAAHELIENEEYKEVLGLLEGAAQRRKLNDHERALIAQTQGFVQSALEDYGAAMASFERCLDFGALPKQMQRNTEYNLGQVYVAAGRYRKAVVLFERWIGDSESPSAEAHYLLAGAYAELDDVERALPHAKRAVDLTSKPKESWLSLLMSTHFQKKQFRQVLGVLKVLIERFPKKAYWRQLASVYGELGDEPRMLAALQLLYEQGYLTKSQELVGLGQVLMAQGLPQQAGVLLRTELDEHRVKRTANNLRVLASAWIGARELKRAEEPLSQAASLSEDGELFLQLAQIFIDQEDWTQAVVAIKHGLGKGGLKDVGHAHLMQGMSYFYLGDREASLRAFTRAKLSHKSRKSANQWLKHIQSTGS